MMAPKLLWTFFFFYAIALWLGRSAQAEDDGVVYKIPFRKQQHHRSRGWNAANDGADTFQQRSAGGIGIELHDHGDLMYTTTVNIGTPAKQFDVIIDTGSSNFWLISSSCCGKNDNFPMGECEHGKLCEVALLLPPQCSGDYIPKKFDSNGSSTSTPTSETFDIEYGDQSWAAGNFIKDVLRFGPVNGSGAAFKIPDTFIGLAEKMDLYSECNHDFDGILGLGFKTAYTSSQQRKPEIDPPLVDAAKRNLLNKSIFTVFLEDGGENETIHGGVMTLGSIDTENCGPMLGWVNLASDNHGKWKFEIENVNYGGNVVFDDSTANGISDTGTSLILGPKEIVQQIVDQIGGGIEPFEPGKELSIPCKQEYEPVGFRIGGKEYAMPKEMLTIPRGNGTCIFGIMGEKRDYWNLGDPFIRQYCQVHDFGEEKRIGFAEIKKKK